MISLKNVTKIYDKNKIAVNNLSLELQAGKIIGFIGPNGAGKTTTLKMMTGILKPTEGSISLNGYDIEKEPLKAKEQYGMVFDSPDAFLQSTGIEYLQFICAMYNLKASSLKDEIIRLATEFEMQNELNNKIETYSHGMRQKIMIIGVLLHKPSIWLLDEPLTGLDPSSSFKLKQMMKEHAALGNVVLFSTHVLEVAEKLCDEIAIINKGEITYQGTLEQLKQQYPDLSLEEIFIQVTSHA